MFEQSTPAKEARQRRDREVAEKEAISGVRMGIGDRSYLVREGQIDVLHNVYGGVQVNSHMQLHDHLRLCMAFAGCFQASSAFSCDCRTASGCDHPIQCENAPLTVVKLPMSCCFSAAAQMSSRHHAISACKAALHLQKR